MARVQFIMAAFLFAFLAIGASAVIVETSGFLSAAVRSANPDSYLMDGEVQTLEVVPVSGAESHVPEKLRQQLTPSGTTLITGAVTSEQSTDS